MRLSKSRVSEDGILSSNVKETNEAQSVRKLSVQLRRVNTGNNVWRYCKEDDLKSLKTATMDYSRGAFGENILHTALLFGSNKCSKWLILNHPKLAMQVYEDDQYFGESILHIIIANNNVHMLDFLLYNDFDRMDEDAQFNLCSLINNYRAIGHFFNPKWGTVDYGQYALSFAVSLNQKESVSKLLQSGANINCLDGNGNNILHYCSKHNLVEMFLHITSKETRAKCNISERAFNQLINHRNEDNFTFFGCAVTLKQKEIFLCILEWKRIHCWQWGKVSFVAYPLNEIDTHGNNKNSILETILADNALSFVNIPVIQACFEEKWNAYAKKYFYCWMVTHILYVIILFFLYRANLDRDKMGVLEHVTSEYYVLNALILAIPGVKAFITTSQTIQDMLGLIREHGRQRGLVIYFQWNMPEVSIDEFFHILLIISNIFIVGVWVTIYLKLHELCLIFMTLSFMSECFYILFFAQSTIMMGRLVVSTLRILTGDMVRFMKINIVVLCAFAGAICFVYPYDTTFGSMFVDLFYISIGSGEFWDDGSNHEWLGTWQIYLNELIYILFLLISALLLMNLLIAIFSETINAIGEKSRLNWLYQRASTILLIERRVCHSWCWINKLLYKRTGCKGTEYGFARDGFDGRNADHFYIAFHLVNDELEHPKKTPGKSEMKKKLEIMKQRQPKEDVEMHETDISLENVLQ